MLKNISFFDIYFCNYHFNSLKTMSNENKKLSQKIKVYHILILGVILSPLIIINSNYVNNQRAEEKLY